MFWRTRSAKTHAFNAKSFSREISNLVTFWAVVGRVRVQDRRILASLVAECVQFACIGEPHFVHAHGWNAEHLDSDILSGRVISPRHLCCSQEPQIVGNSCILHEQLLILHYGFMLSA